MYTIIKLPNITVHLQVKIFQLMKQNSHCDSATNTDYSPQNSLSHLPHFTEWLPSCHLSSSTSPLPSHPPTHTAVRNTHHVSALQQARCLRCRPTRPDANSLSSPTRLFLQSWRQCHLSLMTAILTDGSSAHILTPTEDTTRIHTPI